MELRHIASREGRLSSFLKEEMGMSTGLMNRLKWQDAIFVNGTPQHTDYSVKPGDVITVPLDEPAPDYPAQDGPLTVIYEDAHILAVDKPSGMLIHPSRSCNTGTLANFVAGYYRQTGQSSAFHPMTRLDRDTFGIVLLAKNAFMHTRLQNVPLQKTYHALTFGAPPAPEGIVDAPIARLPLPSLLRHIHPSGKPSLTRYRVMESFDGFSKLALEPVTGRTHQLRLHCAHMDCPILGDPQYNTSESLEFSRRHGLETQLLCASALDFIHPITGKPMHLESRMDVKI